MIAATALLTLGVLLSLYLYSHSRRRERARLPPGPPRLPIIGNLHQAPGDGGWVTFQKWIEQYGPLVSVDFGGNNIIIVGDYDTARDLLDKKANIYSSRPRMVMAQELTCKNMHIMFKTFGTDFLLHQRLEASVLSPRASVCYTPVQDVESKQLLMNMLSSNDFAKQIEIFSASVVYTTTFGLRIVTGDEWQLLTSHSCLKNLTRAGQVGAWIVDALPFLNHLPGPLTPWKKTAEEWYQMWANLHITNLHDALERPGWNWAKDFKNAKEAKEMTEMELAWNLGILCDAGVETTNIQLQIFVLACLAYPDFIAKAQAELDQVIGSDRLPDFQDLENLPYIQAIVEENFRWRHIVPAGIPHATTQDDHHQGYLIPKGSTIIPLFIAMRQDKRIFDSPMDFVPERWINKAQANNFGYGRRVCPGRFIARNSLNIVIARFLWAFNIRSKNGERILVDESTFTTGFVSGPKPFEAVFESRTEQHRRVIEAAFQSAGTNTARTMDQVRQMQDAAGLNPRG